MTTQLSPRLFLIGELPQQGRATVQSVASGAAVERSAARSTGGPSNTIRPPPWAAPRSRSIIQPACVGSTAFIDCRAADA
jgi:hypothetical protein